MGPTLQLDTTRHVTFQNQEYDIIEEVFDDINELQWGPGNAPIERLPTELFDQIIPLLTVDAPANGNGKRNVDLTSCLLVSRTFYAVTLTTLYSRITFPHSYIFSKFLNRISARPELGELVKRLDFSHFTSVGLGRTARMNSEIQNLTASTLLRCLNLTPRLREFLACEAIDCDFSEAVVEKLFCDMPRLEAVDFCAATRETFKQAILSVINPNNEKLPKALTIKRLGMHDCSSLPMRIFETLLPRLPKLTHLDLTHTNVTDVALASIPASANITHLSLSKCNRLTGEAVVQFLTTHPAVRNLKVLNLLYDSTRYRLFSSLEVEELLVGLPKSLVSLNLSGAAINSDHVPLLLPWMERLEELSLGNAELTIQDLNCIFAPEVKNNLHYIDISGVPDVNPRALLFTQSCSLLLESSKPLEVIELSEKMIEGLKERPNAIRKTGWTIKTQGRRGWFVRNASGTTQARHERARSVSPVKTSHESLSVRRFSNEHDIGGVGGKAGVGGESGADDGSRSWKMGGKWWGGRKISCSWGEVCGIYGYYGFGK